MKYIDEFRNSKQVHALAEAISQIMPSGRPLRIMEVCGTHTHAIGRFGLRKLLPETLQLIAGPGCPVCVSSREYIDTAIACARRPDTIITTFGDMVRVPGTRETLDEARCAGADVRIVYSPAESIGIALANPARPVIFLAVGFETTASAIAVTIEMAYTKKIRNLFFLTALKVMPPPMEALLQDKEIRIDGFLCPGHVSAIIGSSAYAFIPRRYGVGCCVAGFEPLDVMEGIYRLIRQIAAHRPAVDNQYSRVVQAGGNKNAQQVMRRVFEPAPALWRGIGMIPSSGLNIRKKFSSLDARTVFPVARVSAQGDALQKRCRCGDVIKGKIMPVQCPLFRRVCTPQKPVGPCMVSYEGACHAHYLYQ